MAFMHGYPGEVRQHGIARHVALMVIVLVVLLGLMIDFRGDIVRELLSGLVPLAIILALMLFVSLKINPRGWKRVFQKGAYQRVIEQDLAVAGELRGLDDNYFIIYDVILELFPIEFLVLSPGGICIIAHVRQEGELSIRDGILFAGERTLEVLTGNLWRVCHLVNIVLRKGYQVDVMPHPVLVAERSEIADYDGIAIRSPEGLADHIRAETDGTVLEREIVEGFAYYVKERYASKT